MTTTPPRARTAPGTQSHSTAGCRWHTSTSGCLQTGLDGTGVALVANRRPPTVGGERNQFEVGELHRTELRLGEAVHQQQQKVDLLADLLELLRL